MGLLSPEFFSAILSIVLMDLVLGGDNAIVIGMAARNLPAKDQNKVIFIGTGGAIVIRSLATIIAVWLLKIPGLMLAGGLLLVWMAYKLLVEDKSEENNIESSSNLWGAVRTIIIADAVMGLDNVLAVAGASHGSPLLVICGLLISIPIVVWGSTLVIKAINRFPIIIPIGAAVIAHTAATMIMGEPFIRNFVGDSSLIEWGLSIILISGVLIVGYQKKKQRTRSNDQQEIA
ncbi:TerC family protein [Desulfitobacterium metallireducens]|uniref:Membrane protein n=1 Tax=Desulfitobacterium metallireducens DSM 15288 TaxID=871968 RepID=W0ECD5_9FIRM|nr:TerC family protein [Desulfitobacterium metallireducens]AHF07158.1 membrane protein [Desulfitobacterium metallireducens DSM 15288]